LSSCWSMRSRPCSDSGGSSAIGEHRKIGSAFGLKQVGAIQSALPEGRGRVSPKLPPRRYRWIESVNVSLTIEAMSRGAARPPRWAFYKATARCASSALTTREHARIGFEPKIIAVMGQDSVAPVRSNPRSTGRRAHGWESEALLQFSCLSRLAVQDSPRSISRDVEQIDPQPPCDIESNWVASN
jgi:hypothetical protein